MGDQTTIDEAGRDAVGAGKARPVMPPPNMFGEPKSRKSAAEAPAAPSAPPAPEPPAAPVRDPRKDSWTHSIRRFGYRYFGTLFLEDTTGGGKALSFGRTAAIALLALCMHSWADHQEIPEGALQTLMALLAYNLGTKGVIIGHALIAARQNAQSGNAAAPPPPGGGAA